MCGEKGNCKWSQAYNLICQTWWRWCHGMSMHGCLWNRLSQLYWWLNAFWKGTKPSCLPILKKMPPDSKCFILHQNNGPKHPASSVKEFIRAKKWKVLDLNQIEHEFDQLKRRVKAETPQNKQQWELAALKAGGSNLKDETKSLVMSMGQRLKGSATK